MSDKLKMTALDKTEMKVTVRLNTYTKIEAIHNREGTSISSIVSGMLDDATKDMPWTDELEERSHELYLANKRKREEAKAKKGIR